MESPYFGPEELSVMQQVFKSCDEERVGRIHINQMPTFLTKMGKTEDEIVKITEFASKAADEQEGALYFRDVLNSLEKFEKVSDQQMEGSDPKVLEFLRILEEYRLKCEQEGNYLEAGRSFKQLGVLRRQEEKRQQKVIQARQISERQDVQLAHNMQFAEFNRSWDKYMGDYDKMAQSYIQQMTERHAIVLLDFQKSLRQELASKPPRWSKELLDQRRKQHISARNKNYTQAQKLKKISDKNEQKERREMEETQAIIFARREAKFRIQQQAELQALLKRIECRRKEHIKQRNIDTKRLLQRNRNVQNVLDTKQKAEAQKLFAEINKKLFSSAILLGDDPQTSSSKSSTSKSLKGTKGSTTRAAREVLPEAYVEPRDDYQYPDNDVGDRNEDRAYRSDDDEGGHNNDEGYSGDEGKGGSSEDDDGYSGDEGNDDDNDNDNDYDDDDPIDGPQGDPRADFDFHARLDQDDIDSTC